MRGLALLQKRIDTASPANLAAMRAEVAASVAATQSFVQQVQGAGSALTTERAALQQASEAARGGVTDFMHAYYDEHKFDRYLQFASMQDEEEYRKREEAYKHAIEAAMAEHTPEGNLRAARLTIEQMKDAGAHGADRSPDFKPMMDGLNKNADNLQTQIDQQRRVEPMSATSRDSAANDPSAALKAAGVSLADESAAAHTAPRDGAVQRSRAT